MSIADKLKTVAQKMEDVYRTGLFKYAPIATASGQSVLLENSAPEPFVNMVVYGKSWQNTTEGKNFFDITKLLNSEAGIDVDVNNNSFTVTPNGGLAVFFSPLRSLIPNVKVGETYTLSADCEVNKYIYIVDTGETWQFGKPMTLTDAQLDSSVYFYGADIDTPQTIRNMQMEVGNVATEYEPYTGGMASPNPQYPQEIQSVSGDVKVLGKNVLPPENVTFAQQYTQMYYPVVLLTFKFEKGKTYTVSFDTPNSGVFFYVNNVTGFDYYSFYGNGQRESVTKTFTEDVELTNMDFISIQEDIGVEGGLFSNVQIELNDVATEYEPYTEQTLNIPTLHGISDVRDYVYYAYGKATKKFKIYVCDSNTVVNDMLQYFANAENRKENAFFRISADGVKQGGNVLCTHLKQVPYLWRDTEDILGCELVENNNIDFTIPLSVLGITSDATAQEREYAMRTWLQSNTIEFCAELAEPIETDLTDEEVYAFKRLRANSPNTTIVGQGQVDVTYIVDNR